jgi:holin-like protein
MLPGVAVILLFQLAGEVLTHLAGWPIPGPVVGLVLLLGALELRRPLAAALEGASAGLLAPLSLLFVPAGVGIVQHAHRLAAEWPALLVAVPLSTAATLAATGLVASRLSRRRAAAGEEGR